MTIIDATPTKRLYRSIIADYGLKTAIAELVDNAIDAWSEQPGGPDLKVEIEIDTDQQSVSITDNAGGVREHDLGKIHLDSGLMGFADKLAQQRIVQMRLLFEAVLPSYTRVLDLAMREDGRELLDLLERAGSADLSDLMDEWSKLNSGQIRLRFLRLS